MRIRAAMVLALVVVIIGFLAVFPSTSEASAISYHFSATVADSPQSFHTGVAGATFTVRNQYGYLVAQGTTSYTGQVTVTGFHYPGESLSVIVTKAGYPTLYAYYTTTGNETAMLGYARWYVYSNDVSYLGPSPRAR